MQNQSIAMKGPFYENYSFRAGHSRLQIKPSGSGDENAREPALPMISGFPLLNSVCHGVFRSRAALNKISCKRRNNPGSKLWSTGRSCGIYEKGSRTHEPADS